MALVTVSSGVASAGGYIGLGIGTGPAASTDGKVFDRDLDLTSDGRSYRVLGGSRFGRFAIEGAFGKFDMFSEGLVEAFDVYQVQVSGKFTLPLDPHFGAFGRLGVNKLWFKNSGDRSDTNVDGSGLVAGAGFEYKFDVVATSGTIFVEYQYSAADLSGERDDWGSSSVRMWTLGATIGF